jgi:CO dehydrogenase/acetyl-CoA synthase delta subunit
MVETKQCETMVEIEVENVKVEVEKEVDKVKAGMEKEVGKVKIEIDNEIAQYRKEIDITGIKFQPTKTNYQTMLVCSWILFAFYLFFFRYTSKN